MNSVGPVLLEYVPGQGIGTADGEILRDCIQCGTCSAICPMIDYMDASPRSLIDMLLTGRHDEVLRSRSVWVCTSCYACTVECPRQFPVTDAIYALKRASMRAGSYPKRFVTPVMARQFVRYVGRRGRSSEAWISVALYLRTRPAQLLRWAPLGMRLMRRGRLPLRRESVRQSAQLRTMLDALETAGEPS